MAWCKHIPSSVHVFGFFILLRCYGQIQSCPRPSVLHRVWPCKQPNFCCKPVKNIPTRTVSLGLFCPLPSRTDFSEDIMKQDCEKVKLLPCSQQMLVSVFLTLYWDLSWAISERNRTSSALAAFAMPQWEALRAKKNILFFLKRNKTENSNEEVQRALTKYASK